MAVLAQYYSGNESYGRSANAALGGMKEGQSLMERKQLMRQSAEQNERAKREFYAKMPLIAAQTTLAQVNAKTAVDNAVNQTNLETRAAAESVAAQNEFNEAMTFNAAYDVEASDGSPQSEADQIAAGKYATQATYEGRIARLSALSAKYAYMSNLKDPGYAAFHETINKALVSTTASSLATARIDEMTEARKLVAEATKYGADKRLEGTQTTVGGKMATADVYTASRERIAALNADTKLTLQERGAKIAAEREGAAIADLMEQAAKADQLAADASREKNEPAAAAHRAVATTYRDAIRKTTTFSGQEPTEVPKESPKLPPKATPKEDRAPLSVSITIPGSDTPIPVATPRIKVPKNATTVTVEGKTYTIYKDKNGGRAYKTGPRPEDYVDLDTE